MLVFFVVSGLGPVIQVVPPFGILGTTLLLLLATGPFEYFSGRLDSDNLRHWMLVGLVAVASVTTNVILTLAGQPGLASLLLFVGATLLGILIGRFALLDRDLLLMITVLYIVVDIYSVFFGPTQAIIARGGNLLAFLTVRFPILGTPRIASLVGASDFLVWGACLQAAFRFGFRYQASFIAILAGLFGSALISIIFQRAVPALPLMMVGYLMVNAREFDWTKRSLWATAAAILAVVLVVGALGRWLLVR